MEIEVKIKKKKIETKHYVFYVYFRKLKMWNTQGTPIIIVNTNLFYNVFVMVHEISRTDGTRNSQKWLGTCDNGFQGFRLSSMQFR